ncbi:MAG TPA: class F sortase [Candidatus Saccharimonadales bacterium]
MKAKWLTKAVLSGVVVGVVSFNPFSSSAGIIETLPALAPTITTSPDIALETTTTVAPPTSTTMLAPIATLIDMAPADRLVIGSVGIDWPIVNTGPRYDRPAQWYPDWGTVELYGQSDMVDPGEVGGAFILGHSNVAEQGPDTFFNLVDDEEYDDDYGVNPGDIVDTHHENGTYCRFRVIDIRQLDAPGEPLALSPGRYFPKFDNWGKNGPNDERLKLVNLATEAGRPYLYLMGSYAGPEGNKFVGGNRYYTAYIAAVLVDCQPEGE